jgi:ABC-type nitrate/sulfonate/bicarbonate transport system permease component
MSSRTAVAWSFSVLFVVHGISAAIRRAPAELAEWLRATGAGTFLRIRKVYGPGLVPFLLRDLRRALPLAAGGALTAEVIAADEGLGHLMVRGVAAGDVCLLFAALCLAMLFVAAAAAVIRLMEKLAFGRSLAVLPGAHASVLW